MIFSFNKLMTSLISIPLLLGISSTAFGRIHLSLTGFQDKVHAEYQKTYETEVEGSIAVDILAFMRIGYSYEKKTEKTSGYREPEPNTFEKFENTIETIKHSANLTLVPFSGEIITPFVYGGIAQKYYKYRLWGEYAYDGEVLEVKINPGDAGTKRYVYNFGIGLTIALNRNLSIKIQNSWSEGSTRKPGGDSETTMDSQIKYGVTYAF